jgi:hypothetical protein
MHSPQQTAAACCGRIIFSAVLRGIEYDYQTVSRSTEPPARPACAVQPGGEFAVGMFSAADENGHWLDQ